MYSLLKYAVVFSIIISDLNGCYLSKDECVRCSTAEQNEVGQLTMIEEQKTVGNLSIWQWQECWSQCFQNFDNFRSCRWHCNRRERLLDCKKYQRSVVCDFLLDRKGSRVYQLVEEHRCILTTDLCSLFSEIWQNWNVKHHWLSVREDRDCKYKGCKSDIIDEARYLLSEEKRIESVIKIIYKEKGWCWLWWIRQKEWTISMNISLLIKMEWWQFKINML